MTKQQKLEAIYEAMADKRLLSGCRFRLADKSYNTWYGDELNIGDDMYDGYMTREYTVSLHMQPILLSDMEIIGHPVRIGDVLDWFDRNNPNHLWGGNGVINGEIIIRQWDHLRLPIDDQEEECVDFVYSLITK